MTTHKPRASDITDEAFLAALEPDGRWTSRWDVTERLGFPEKVVLAKARTLIKRRGTVHGCACGCRGDWHRADECRSGYAALLGGDSVTPNVKALEKKS